MLTRALFSLLWGRDVEPFVAALVLLFLVLGGGAIIAELIRRR